MRLPGFLFFAVITACRGDALPDEATMQATVVARAPTFVEGIVFDSAGEGYFSELWSERIWRWRIGRAPEVWARVPNPNGHRILSGGRHVVASFGANAVVVLDSLGTVQRTISTTDAGPLRDPNDLYPDSSGGIYFTDSVDSTGTVNYLAPDGRATTLVQHLRYPNGIVLRPDGKTLLVTEFLEGRILSFPVTRPGHLGTATVFATMPPKADSVRFAGPDGMALDIRGNLYVAYYGAGQVVVFAPDGRLLRRYSVGSPQASNVAFGGPLRDQLYVTSAESHTDSTRGVVVRLDLRGTTGLRIPAGPRQ